MSTEKNPASDTAREAAERQHTMQCEFPEGCSCGASEWNALLASTAALRREVEELRAERDKAVAFASKVERGEVRFAQQVDEQMQRIVALPLGKTIHEGISDAVARVLSERDAALQQVAELTRERDEAVHNMNHQARLAGKTAMELDAALSRAEAAEKAMQSIRSSFARLETAGCSCYSDPEGSCEYCNVAESITETLNEALAAIDAAGGTEG